MKFLIRPLVEKASASCGVQSGNCGRQCDRCGSDCTFQAGRMIAACGIQIGRA